MLILDKVFDIAIRPAVDQNVKLIPFENNCGECFFMNITSSSDDNHFALYTIVFFLFYALLAYLPRASQASDLVRKRN